MLEEYLSIGCLSLSSRFDMFCYLEKLRKLIIVLNCFYILSLVFIFAFFLSSFFQFSSITPTSKWCTSYQL